MTRVSLPSGIPCQLCASKAEFRFLRALRRAYHTQFGGAPVVLATGPATLYCPRCDGALAAVDSLTPYVDAQHFGGLM